MTAPLCYGEDSGIWNWNKLASRKEMKTLDKLRKAELQNGAPVFKNTKQRKQLCRQTDRNNAVACSSLSKGGKQALYKNE